VARREGLVEPIPVTRRFPGMARATETDWQEMVIRHLGISEWHRVTIDDELDLVGPLASRHLLEHGVLWPPTIHGDIPLTAEFAGGHVLDGEGGDEVLGVEAHRIAPVRALARSPRHASLRRLRSAAGAVLPPSVRRQRALLRYRSSHVTWLRADAQQELVDAVVEVEVGQPLSYERSVHHVPRRRTQSVLRRNRRALAQQRRSDIQSPLLHPDFVAALGRDGGFLGRGDRTAVIRSIANDLLPDALLSRTSKAIFNQAFLGPHAREFARHWDGSGVDHSIVDAEELRRIWQSERGHAMTSALLQAAWLSHQSPSQS